MTDRIEILLVEDNPGDVRLLREALAEAGDERFRLNHVTHLAQGFERLEEDDVDVVLLDLSLPDSSGLETLIKTRAAAPDVPLVVLTGLADERLAVEAVRQGAQDYLVKGAVEGEVLARCIRYALERHRLAVELERARREQLETKNKFLSHVSHELRTPLTAIYQLTTILADGLAGEIGAEQKEHLGVILRNVDQLKRMIQDLVEGARVAMGKVSLELHDVDVRSVMSDVLHSLRPVADEKNVGLSTVEGNSGPLVRADPDRVYEILLNLVDNAIKFTPEGGRVTMAATTLAEDGHFIKISVTDTGPGISPELRETVFERWYQEERSARESRKGLGLGLHICRELVARQGGRIWADAAPGGGTVFSFTLPAADLRGDARG